MWCPQVIEVEMAQAASGPDLGGPLTIFLVVGFHRAATNRPLMLKKLYNFFELKDHSAAIKVSETIWHVLGVFFRCCIFKQICFFPMWALRQARLTEVYRIRISGLESGRIQHIFNKPDRTGLRFYSSFLIRMRIFKFHCFGIWRQHNHKKNVCKLKGCKVL